jgi:hypothetical protein
VELKALMVERLIVAMIVEINYSLLKASRKTCSETPVSFRLLFSKQKSLNNIMHHGVVAVVPIG